MSQFRQSDMRGKSDFVKLEMVNMNLELAELIQRLPHKHWKKYVAAALKGWTSEEQRTETLFEYVDIFHFFINIALILEFSPEEVYHCYLAKNKENHDRQDRGY